MRLRHVVTLCLASAAAVLPFAVRGERFEDPRHQLRREAARLLRSALQVYPDGMPASDSALDEFRSAMTRAIKVLGPNSEAASELSSRGKFRGTIDRNSRVIYTQEAVTQMPKAVTVCPNCSGKLEAPVLPGEEEACPYCGHIIINRVNVD